LTEGKLTAVAIVNRFGHWFGTGLVVPVLAIFQIDRGLSLTQVGINGLIFAAMVAVLEIPTGGLSDTLGRRRVYLISLVVSIVTAGVFVFAHSPVTLAAGFALMGMARALSSGCMDAYFIDASSASSCWPVFSNCS
jgi:MFS family permease